MLIEIKGKAPPYVGARAWCDPGASGEIDRLFKGHLFREANTCERCGVTKQSAARQKARAKSSRVDEAGTMRFVLIKSPDHDARSGARIGALAAAKQLLNCGFWPLWKNTPGRIVVDGGDYVCIYLSGSGSVIASARIAKILPWSRVFAEAYPLALGGVPELVLILVDIEVFVRPVAARNHVDQMDCVGRNKLKWGAAFCGGMRSLTTHDYRLLTASTSKE